MLWCPISRIADQYACFGYVFCRSAMDRVVCEAMAASRFDHYNSMLVLMLKLGGLALNLHPSTLLSCFLYGEFL